MDQGQPQVLFSRQMPSDKALLGSLVRDIEIIRTELGLDQPAFYNFMIAFTEAVNNAIVHGNQADPGKYVRMQIERAGRGVRCVVEDQGTGFDEAQVADPIDPDNLMAESGRGVFIIRALMAQVQIENTGHGTRITFVCLPTDD